MAVIVGMTVVVGMTGFRMLVSLTFDTDLSLAATADVAHVEIFSRSGRRKSASGFKLGCSLLAGNRSR
jgi:hypothetical protein